MPPLFVFSIWRHVVKNYHILYTLSLYIKHNFFILAMLPLRTVWLFSFRKQHVPHIISDPNWSASSRWHNLMGEKSPMATFEIHKKWKGPNWNLPESSREDLQGTHMQSQTTSSWWLNQPNWKKMLVKLGIFSPNRGENKKYLSCHQLVAPPPIFWGVQSSDCLKLFLGGVCMNSDVSKSKGFPWTSGLFRRSHWFGKTKHMKYLGIPLKTHEICGNTTKKHMKYVGMPLNTIQ